MVFIGNSLFLTYGKGKGKARGKGWGKGRDGKRKEGKKNIFAAIRSIPTYGIHWQFVFQPALKLGVLLRVYRLVFLKKFAWCS